MKDMIENIRYCLTSPAWWLRLPFVILKAILIILCIWSWKWTKYFTYTNLAKLFISIMLWVLVAFYLLSPAPVGTWYEGPHLTCAPHEWVEQIQPNPENDNFLENSIIGHWIMVRIRGRESYKIACIPHVTMLRNGDLVPDSDGETSV